MHLSWVVAAGAVVEALEKVRAAAEGQRQVVEAVNTAAVAAGAAKAEVAAPE